jgi:hypothetical protein
MLASFKMQLHINTWSLSLVPANITAYQCATNVLRRPRCRHVSVIYIYLYNGFCSNRIQRLVKLQGWAEILSYTEMEYGTDRLIEGNEAL